MGFLWWFCVCLFVCLYLCAVITHVFLLLDFFIVVKDIKFTIIIMFKCAVSMFVLLYIHHHRPSPELFSSCQTETLFLLDSNSPLATPCSLWHPPFTFCLCEFDCSRYLTRISKSCRVCPFMSGLFHLTKYPQYSSMS